MPRRACWSCRSGGEPVTVSSEAWAALVSVYFFAMLVIGLRSAAEKAVR